LVELEKRGVMLDLVEIVLRGWWEGSNGEQKNVRMFSVFEGYGVRQSFSMSRHEEKSEAVGGTNARGEGRLSDDF